MPNIDIAELRLTLGGGEKPISQEELGRLLGGVDQATVSRWETGVSRPPKSAVILMQQLLRANEAPASKSATSRFEPAGVPK